MTVAPETSDVQAFTEQVWSSFLGDEEPLLPRFIEPDSPFEADTVWSSAITVSGGWEALITVEISGTVANELTRLMLGIDDAPAEEDIADAVGELVNMIGGNIKSLMPGPSALSLPVVAAGHAAHPASTKEVARFDGIWAGEPVRVSVHVKA